MKKQLYTLMDSFRGSNEPQASTEIFAACCAWVKLIETNKLEPEHLPQPTGVIDQLRTVINHCVTDLFTPPDCRFSDEEIHYLLTSLQDLIRANVISYADLSEAIKTLLEDSGKKGSEMTVPNDLTQLGVTLLGEQVDSVYCPFNAGQAFAHQLPKASQVAVETPYQSNAFYAEVHNLLLDREIQVACANPIFAPTLIGDGGLKEFQSAISFPPIGQKFQKNEIKDIWGRFPEQSLMGDVYQLRHMLAHATGCVVSFVANGFLFRSAAGEKQFKQDMVRKHWLKAVIALPSNLLSWTGIPVSIIVLDKNKSDDSVLFIDASSEFFVDKTSRLKNKLTNVDHILSLFKAPTTSKYSQLCSTTEIEENDYNLSPSRYVLTQEEIHLQNFLKQHSTSKLSDLVDIIRPQAVKHDESGVVEYLEHNLTSLNRIGQLKGKGKTVLISEADVAKAEKQKIHPYDVLVSCRGAIGRVALIEGEIADNVIASQAFAILRPKSNVNGLSSIALYQYLISSHGQFQLSSLATGTTALMLSAKDLNNIDIPIFSANMQTKLEHIRQEVLAVNAKMLELQQHINKLNSDWLTQSV